ncbi:hypothetical protein [Candidatus Sneabacter namystus]|uniref:Uncharacterized protein n=1 Tax=Candidatus Sneabacter namystus TaxID=2601646 RepID=A0A5C0UIE1_9RICK|nr:hypothetical protein [Candidatus Sneabacter namystus]QEK39371.1 hypothetical protein FZC37_00205 [Candidatus Sneabacter namystus]
MKCTLNYLRKLYFLSVAILALSIAFYKSSATISCSVAPSFSIMIKGDGYDFHRQKLLCPGVTGKVTDIYRAREYMTTFDLEMSSSFSVLEAGVGASTGGVLKFLEINRLKALKDEGHKLAYVAPYILGRCYLPWMSNVYIGGKIGPAICVHPNNRGSTPFGFQKKDDTSVLNNDYGIFCAFEMGVKFSVGMASVSFTPVLLRLIKCKDFYAFVPGIGVSLSIL